MNRLLFCLLLAAGPAFAGPAWLSGFSSQHSANGADLRTNNYGQGYRNEEGYAILSYRNSYDRDSLFVGREFKAAGRLAAGLIVGAVTGYPMMPVAPVALPELVYTGRTVEVAAVYMPAPTKNYVAAFAIQLRIAVDMGK